MIKTIRKSLSQNLDLIVQMQTIRKMEQAYWNCDEATKAAVAMIHKILVDEGAKCSDMPRVLE